MKLIKPYYEIWEQSAGLEGIYKQIERAGKICYKSEHTIKDGSAKPFVDRLINMKHLSVLEHGTVYLYMKGIDNIDISKYSYNKYSKAVEGNLDHFYITTNLRVLIENNWLDDLKYLCEPTEFHEKRVTVHFVCDRGVSHEYVRHKLLCVA